MIFHINAFIIFHIQILIGPTSIKYSLFYFGFTLLFYQRSQQHFTINRSLFHNRSEREEEDEAKMGINLYSPPKRLPRQGPRCHFHNRPRFPLLRRPLRPSVGERNLRSSDLSAVVGYHIGERGSFPHR